MSSTVASEGDLRVEIRGSLSELYRYMDIYSVTNLANARIE